MAMIAMTTKSSINVKPAANPSLTPPRRGTRRAQELVACHRTFFKDRRKRQCPSSTAPRHISNPDCRWRRLRLAELL